jgi:hypothetical protein
MSLVVDGGPAEPAIAFFHFQQHTFEMERFPRLLLSKFGSVLLAEPQVS